MKYIETLNREHPKEKTSLKTILLPILPKLEVVESQLRSVSGECEGILKDSSGYVLNGEGKRFRAALVLFCASIPKCDGDGLHSIKDPAIKIAAAVELIHAATLVHDDIVDRALLRRLKPTVNIQYGEDVAVLLGDYLYSKAFKMIAEVGDLELTQALAATTQGMCEGEIGQLKSRFRPHLSEEEYFSFIERKTASLISVSARAGAKCAGLPKNDEESLAKFALNIGISYQIIDDLLDVIGVESKMGKTLRTDTGNGKMTLPMIFLFERLSEIEKEKFASGFSLNRLDWSAIQNLFFQHKIAELTKNAADRYFDKAVHSLNAIDSKVKDSLSTLSRFVLNRDY